MAYAEEQEPWQKPVWNPFDVQIEQAILGTLLVYNSGMEIVRPFLRAEHFNEAPHRLIYEIMETLTSMGKPATPMSIKPFIQDHQVTAGMTVSQYIARLASEALGLPMLKDHAMIVRDLALRRGLMDVAWSLEEPLPKDIKAVATEALDAIDSILNEHSTSHGRRQSSMQEVMLATIGGMATAYQNGGRIMGMKTNLSVLDRKLHGLKRGQLIVVGGRPGMGKSALACSWARQFGLEGKKGIFFSLEMSKAEIGERMAADHLFNSGPVTFSSLSGGRFNDATFNRVMEARERLENLPLYVEDEGGQTIGQISARARLVKNTEGLDYLIVDHLQIIRTPSNGNKFSNRVREIGEITSSLKALAKNLDIVVILLSQLSRALESREDKRPTLNDLRESGDIEQDADVVIMVFRESYYLERRQPAVGTPEHAVWQTACLRAANKLELIVEKQRGGPTGTVDVFCNIGCNALRDLDEHEILPTAAAPRQDDEARFL